jgi:hypothetical protein
LKCSLLRFAPREKNISARLSSYYR